MAKLLHFTAIWCKPCEKIKPIIEEYVTENTDIEYQQIDVDNNIKLVKEDKFVSVNDC